MIYQLKHYEKTSIEQYTSIIELYNIVPNMQKPTW